MSETSVPAQVSRDSIRVRGEKVPVVVLIGFVLAGVIGSIITAWLVLPSVFDRSNLGGSRFEGTFRATHEPPAVAQVKTDETPVAPNLADDTDARPDEETPSADEKNAKSDSGDSAMATGFQVDPSKSGVQSAGSDAQSDAGSEQEVDKVASGQQTVDKVAIDCAPLFPIKFGFGSVRPQVAGMKQKLERLAAWLNANPTATLSLDGHADASGPEEYNLLLSFRRAAAVASLLEDAGTSKTQLIVRAHGEGQSSLRSADAALERRVVLTIDAGEPCDEPSFKAGALR